MEKISGDFFIGIDRVVLAHEFTLTESNKCDYSEGRSMSGISLAISGEAKYNLKNGKSFTVKAGDAVFLPSGIKYTVEIGGSYRHYTANFTVSPERSSFLPPEDTLTVLHGCESGFLSGDFSALAKVWAEKEFGYEMKAMMYLYRLLDSFVARLQIAAVSENKSYKRLLPAKEYIDKNYEKELSLSLLAGLSDMSETNFRRLFLSVFSKTYLQYRDSLRLLKAKDYLAGGFYSVTETAYACGFTDVSYFCRFFKKHTGRTPLGYTESL